VYVVIVSATIVTAKVNVISNTFSAKPLIE
jgi:hypothetical protein